MIRNRDAEDAKIVRCILRKPGITFGELLTQATLATSTLRYRLATLELAGEIVCKKWRNKNQYFPKKSCPVSHGRMKAPTTLDDLRGRKMTREPIQDHCINSEKSNGGD